MDGPCAAFTQVLPLAQTHTHSLPPLAMMEVGVASPLKILQMSSVRERWQPGGP